MSDWIDIGREGSLADGEHLVIEVNGSPVAVFRVGGRYYAVQNRCSHDFYTGIAEGWLEGCNIVCPRHGARFSLVSGKVLSPPAFQDLPVFPVRVEQGRIQVGTDGQGCGAPESVTG
jgi:3-phenylpropionate/trans-cinnamate dioxygenase ferredoxin subunit